MNEHIEVAQKGYAAFAAGDIPAVLELWHDDIEWQEAENSPYDGGIPYVGKDAVVEHVLMRLATEWDGFTIHVEEMLDCGDRLVALGRYTGTYKATGLALNAAMAHVWTMRDGKFATFTQYTDTLQYAAVTGTRNREIRRPTGIS
jgi:uncharacterized protein